MTLSKRIDIHDIERIIDHRYPFLLIDRVVEIKDNTIHAYKNVTINEGFFQGHFPNNPIMPGVLQLEAMGQAGCILISQKIDDFDKHYVYMAGLRDAKFYAPVIPGDQLNIHMELMRLKRGMAFLHGKCVVDDQVVSTGKAIAALVPKSN